MPREVLNAFKKKQGDFCQVAAAEWAAFQGQARCDVVLFSWAQSIEQVKPEPCEVSVLYHLTHSTMCVVPANTLNNGLSAAIHENSALSRRAEKEQSTHGQINKNL